MVAFLGLFVAAGTAIGYFLSFRPLYQAYQARAWAAADCEVLSSRVAASGKTARPEIRYRYSVADRAYTSDRYHFLPGSNSDATVRDAVERYAPGTRFQCFVDPADPTQAVINRDVTTWYYFGLIFFGAFAGIPLLLGTFALRQFSSARAAQQRADMTIGVPAMIGVPAGGVSGSGALVDTGPTVLQPTTSPMGKLVAATILCLFWNGLVGVFTYFEIQQFASGDGSWFLAIFLLIFQAIGVALLLALPYQLLALANPRPRLTLSRATLPIGGTVPFEWQLVGAANRVTRLTLALRGREEARYRRGTNTRTDWHEFHSDVIADAADPISIEHGSGTIRIPAGTMHSFAATNNKIIWTITVKGEIARWPDIDESFEITVSPS